MFVVFEIIDRDITDEVTVRNFEEAIEAGEQMFIRYLREIDINDEKIEEYAGHFATEDEWNGSAIMEDFYGMRTSFGYEVESEAFNFWCNVDRDYDVYCIKVGA